MLAEVTQLNARITELAAVITNQNATGVSVTTEPVSVPVAVLAKQGPGSDTITIFAVAMRDAKVRATFRVPSGAAASVMWEDNRTLPIQGGLFTDQFDSYGVHIYKIKKGARTGRVKVDDEAEGAAAEDPPPRVAWADSSTGIHTILVGDSANTPDQVKALAKDGAAPDFIWGGYRENIAQWRKLNPEIVITKYVSFGWDPCSGKSMPCGNRSSDMDGDCCSHAWWVANHPSWIMYRADRKTPAFKCYPPSPCDYPMPLDITNPEVVQFQIEHGVLPAKAQGYNGIAWDNFDLVSAAAPFVSSFEEAQRKRLHRGI